MPHAEPIHVQPMPPLNNDSMYGKATNSVVTSITTASLNGQAQHEPSGTKAWATSPKP